MTQPKISTFRTGGGSFVPTVRPSATSVGVGPIGCDVRGYEGYGDERVAQNIDPFLGLAQFGFTVFDYWSKQEVARAHAAAATQAIKDERHFDSTLYAALCAKLASATPEVRAKETYAGCFSDPFAGVIVQQNLYTEVVEDGEYAYHFEEPMSAFLKPEEVAGPEEVTGYEAAEKPSGPSIGAVPRLMQLVEDKAGQGSYNSYANDVLTQVWWFLNMRAVVLYPKAAWGWTVAKTRTIDRCPPSVLTWLLWKVLGIWRP